MPKRRFEWKRSRYRKVFPFAGGAMLLLGSIFCTPSPLLAATYIDIPAGDSAALFAAVRAANQTSGLTVIRLDSRSEYELDLSTTVPDPLSSQIMIQGEGAQLVGSGSRNFGSLFIVLAGGTLELSDLVVRGFDNREDQTSDREDGLIAIRVGGVLIGRDLQFEDIHARSSNRINGAIFTNRGELDLDRVRIAHVSVSGPVSSGAIAIHNANWARFQNLLIIDGKGIDPGFEVPVGNYITNIGNASLELNYGSLILESESSGVSPQISSVFGAGGFGIHPSASITATMIVDMGCPNNTGEITSGGFNLFSEGPCPYRVATDLVGVSPGMLQFRRGPDGGIEIQLPKNSRALDRVRNSTFACPGSDAVGIFRPQDGNGDGKARCDIGAFENEAGRPLLSGGANGLFYSAGSDGHYVTIQEVRPDEYVIFWNTFDLNGNQAWVLAVGEREGDVIAGQGYFQPSGILVPGAGADVDTSQLQEWGTIEIELTDCLEGTFAYVSELPQFGSGTFNLDRLALVEGLGCQSD